MAMKFVLTNPFNRKHFEVYGFYDAHTWLSELLVHAERPDYFNSRLKVFDNVVLSLDGERIEFIAHGRPHDEAGRILIRVGMMDDSRRLIENLDMVEADEMARTLHIAFAA